MAELPKGIPPTVWFGFFICMEVEGGTHNNHLMAIEYCWIISYRTRVLQKGRRKLLNCSVRKKIFLLIAWLFFSSSCAASSSVAETCSELSCEVFDICVLGGLTNEKDTVCIEAKKVRDFFQGLELDLPVQLRIFFKQEINPTDDYLSIGCYDPETNNIILLDYQSAVAASHLAPPAFGTPMNFDLWRSYLVHEIVHVIVEKNYTAEYESIAPTEYIAAVAQLSTLPDNVLDHILANYNEIHPFKDKSEITDLYYFMKPCEFAVKSYLHYAKPENGQSFIRELLHQGLPGSGVRAGIPFF